MATTPLMNLVLPAPGPGGTPGPGYATDNNAAFTLIDSHDHSPGKGALIKTAGIQIDSDFSFVSFNATVLRSTKYDDQVAAFGTGDLRAVYSVNGDLFWNNGAGASVQITAGAGLNAASIGGIGGDFGTSTAAVTYNDTTKVFTFTQDSGIAAHIAVADVVIFEPVLSANGITLQSPAALAGAYSLTLPAALPGTTQLLQVTSGGIMNPTTSIPVLDITTSQIVNLKVRNPGDTFSYNIIASAIIADRNVTLPLLTGNDEFAMVGFAQTLVGKTLTAPIITNPILTVDTIDEFTTDNGVVIDGLIIKNTGFDPSVWPSFFAHLNGVDQDNITGNTTVVEFDDDSTGEGFDTNDDFDTTTFTFTPTQAGTYLLIARIAWKNTTIITGDGLALVIKNAAGTINFSTDFTSAQNSTDDESCSCSVIVQANGTTDAFKCVALNTNRDTSDISGIGGASYFTGCRIA